MPYLPGFNDDFVSYSGAGLAGSVMPKLKAAGGQAARIGVDWGLVQPDGPESWDFSSIEAIRIQAMVAGVQILPTVYGCPDWAGPVITASPRTGRQTYPADYFRTCSPEYDPDFGRFADRTIRHFDAPAFSGDAPRLIPGVEILNEPNFWTFGDVPAGRLIELTSAAAEAVAASARQGAFSAGMRVISGGLAPLSALAPGEGAFPARPSWQEYLGVLSEAGGDFDIGFHSYETAQPPAGTLTIPERNPEDAFGRARQFAEWQSNRIVGKVDAALAITSRDVWVTETGASSAATWPDDIFTAGYRLAHGERIQAEVLTRVAAALESRPRCRSMIVHRLFSNDEAEPPTGSNESSDYYQYGVYDAIDGAPKLAVAALAAEWS